MMVSPWCSRTRSCTQISPSVVRLPSGGTPVGQLVSSSCPLQPAGFHAANAGATLIAIITTIRATTLNNTRMRFFMHYLLTGGRGDQPRQLASTTTLASIGYQVHHA